MNSNTMIDNFVNMHAIRAMWYRWAWCSCGAAHQSGWLCNYIAKEERHSAAFIWASTTTALNAHKESWFWYACVFKNCTLCRKNFYLNLSVMTYKFMLNWCMHARSKRPAHYLKKSHLFATSFTSHPTVPSPPHLCMDRRISFSQFLLWAATVEIEYSLEFRTMLKRLRKFVPHISPQFGASHPAHVLMEIYTLSFQWT